MCPRCSAISTRHMSEQVHWCVATRHLTVEATKPGPTVHVSVRPQDICHLCWVRGVHKTCVCGKERPQTSGFATRHVPYFRESTRHHQEREGSKKGSKTAKNAEKRRFSGLDDLFRPKSGLFRPRNDFCHSRSKFRV